jgi:hypothetical protein
MKHFYKILLIFSLLLSPGAMQATLFKTIGEGLTKFANNVKEEIERSEREQKRIEEEQKRIEEAQKGLLVSWKSAAERLNVGKYNGQTIKNMFPLDGLIPENRNILNGITLSSQNKNPTSIENLNTWTDYELTQENADAFKNSVNAAAEKILATIKQKEDDKRADEKANKDALREVGKNAAKGIQEGLFTGMKADAEGRNARENNAQMFSLVAQKLSEPATILGAVGAIIAVIGGGKLVYDGSQLIIRRIKDALEQPDIISESTIPANPWERIKQLVLGREEKPSRLDEFKAPNKELAEALPDLINEIREAHEAQADLPNLLFYGPPGTGKTMFAEILAKETGKEYCFLSGSAFALCTEAQAVQKIKEMASYMKAQEQGGIIFIDEAEIVFADRTYPDTSALAKAVTNEFLSLFPKPSDPKLMFIFCSNNAGAMDVAINSRISKSLAFVLPSFETKLEMMCNYLKKEELELDANLLPRLNDLKATFDGFSGRDIEDIVKDIARKVNAGGKELTYELLTKAIYEKRNKNIFTQKERDKFQKARFGQQIDSAPLAAAAA